MNQLEKKEVIQAIVVADNFNDSFTPFTNTTSSALIPIVNVPIIDYTLESLNRCGVEEVFLFCSSHIENVKNHIKNRKADQCSWSINMDVNIVSSEGCRCLGDALRDLDAKGLIRGNFILMGADTVSNVNLLPILEEHKKNSKYDKGASMTVVYKKIAPNQRTGDEVVIATDKNTNRLLSHQRVKLQHKERHFSFPMEIFSVNKEVVLHHDLADPQIAICGPTVLPLFSDNFDFLTRDDFIKGLLINEEILASTIYVSELPTEQYAAKVSNWQTYQIVSKDVVNRWAFPLVPDMGICALKQHYSFWRNNIYRHKNIHLERGSILKSDVVINENCFVDDQSIISYTVLGRNCKIGKNCQITNSFILDDCVIENDCVLDHCVIGKGAKICAQSEINDGSVIGEGSIIPTKSTIKHLIIQSTEPDSFDVENSVKLGDKAFTIPDPEEDEVEDSDEEDEARPSNVVVKMTKLERNYAASYYSSSSDDDDYSRPASPIQEDWKIFLSEVIESLRRGYREKSNPDYLILEINSSRFAYNMDLSEVNFYMVKAILRLIEEQPTTLLSALNQLLVHFGPIIKKYIRGQDAMLDCLKAFEDTCNEKENFRTKLAQIIHYLYDKEIVTADAILVWHESLAEESEWMKTPLSKLITWLNESSEEEESSEEDDS